jgi:hypothetical protein
VQTNDASWSRRGEVTLDGDFSVTFLAKDENIVVLGTSLALQDATQHEIRNRVAAGWRLFWAMKHYYSISVLLSSRDCAYLMPLSEAVYCGVLPLGRYA